MRELTPHEVESLNALARAQDWTIAEMEEMMSNPELARARLGKEEARAQMEHGRQKEEDSGDR